MSNEIIVGNLQKRPPIPPHSKIPNRTIPTRSSTPTPSPIPLHLLLPNSRFGFKPPSRPSSPVSSSLKESRSESSNNNNKSAIYKRSHGQQQRLEQEQQASSSSSSSSLNKSLLPQSPFLSRPPISVAELAAKFLEENVRNCIKPRIFPVHFSFSFSHFITSSCSIIFHDISSISWGSCLPNKSCLVYS
jgi:hypothetical protein